MGLPRQDLVSDDLFVDGEITIGAAAAVGSNEYWNDDIASNLHALILVLPTDDDPIGDGGGDDEWPVGISEERLNDGIQILMQQDLLVVSAGDWKELSIYSITGQLLGRYEAGTSARSGSISLAHVPTGIALVSLIDAYGEHTTNKIFIP